MKTKFGGRTFCVIHDTNIVTPKEIYAVKVFLPDTGGYSFLMIKGVPVVTAPTEIDVAAPARRV